MITSFFDYYEEEAPKILKLCTHIYCDEEVFVCGYKTHSCYILKNVNKKLDISDTWYVYYAAGKVTKLFEIFENKKYICFHRLNRDKLKLYNMREFYGKIKKQTNS
jgi:hypothetical protein